MRVTALGHDRIHKGEADPKTLKALKFASGDVFDCPVENVGIYEARGMARRVAHDDGRIRPEHLITTYSATDDAMHERASVDHEAIARLAARSKRDPQSGCLVWQGSKDPGGYGQITYRRVFLRTHRLSWAAHKGPIPPGQHVCHRCDNRACIAIEHLFLGTQQENLRDMLSKGRRAHARLKRDDVARIRARLASGESTNRIALDYGVGRTAIQRIASGQAWREIEAVSEG